MSPTVFRIGKYRFYFFSREEDRPHIHVVCPEGEAKFWLEPEVLPATYTGVSRRQLTYLKKLVESRRDEISKAWEEHFKAGDN
jgi:hypothetical protein